MEPLEQVTILMTLMRRLGQVMEHERAILRSLRVDILPDVQEEKYALAEAYEIELSRLRCTPEVLASLDPRVRSQLDEAMREFQHSAAANLHAQRDARASIESALHCIKANLAESVAEPGRGRDESSAEPRGQVIELALEREG